MVVFSWILGFLFGISFTIIYARYFSKVAYDGAIVVSSPEEGKKVFSLELNGDPNDLEQKTAVTFKITSLSE